MLVEYEGTEIGIESAHGVGLRRAADLSVGNTYVVNAIAINRDRLILYLCDDIFDSLKYPVPYDSRYFRIIDCRVSSCWCLNWQVQDLGTVLLGFEEWSRERMFYERLVDGAVRECEVFLKYKKFMDFEFPMPHALNQSILVSGNWIQCPFCSSIWETKSSQGLVQCPDCGRVSGNPNYASKETGT